MTKVIKTDQNGDIVILEAMLGDSADLNTIEVGVDAERS
jgi:hypothetical protein